MVTRKEKYSIIHTLTKVGSSIVVELRALTGTVSHRNPELVLFISNLFGVLVFSVHKIANCEDRQTFYFCCCPSLSLLINNRYLLLLLEIAFSQIAINTSKKLIYTLKRLT